MTATTTRPICSRCDEPIAPPTNRVTTGYGKDGDGHIVCYPCCALEDQAWMEAHDRMTLYLSATNGSADASSTPTTPVGLSRAVLRPKWEVTNWPGSLRFSAYVDVKPNGHNWGLTRRDVWFTDHTGAQWWGVQYGDFTQLCHCRKLKATS